jgi:hypothetical protein
VHNTLARSVPDADKTEEVHDMVAFFRAMIARVDSSLLQAWEELVRPSEKPVAPDAPPPEYDLAQDARGLRARIRSELQPIVRALATKRHADVAEALHPACRDVWGAARLDAELAPFYERYDAILYDPRARQAHLCVIDPIEPRLWRVRQVLIDDADDRFFAIEGEVDLRAERNPGDPLLRLRRIGE